MERAIRIMNYFIIIAAVVCFVIGYQNNGEMSAEFVVPVIAIASILFYKRSYRPLWRNVSFLATFLFIVGILIVPLHLDLLASVYFGSYEFALFALIILLTFLCARLRLSTNVLTIMWTVYYLLNLYGTFQLAEGESFLFYLNSPDVIMHLQTNYLSLLLLGVVIGIFFDTRGERNLN